MKLYLIAVLLFATLVAVPCLAEEETKMEAAEPVADAPEAAPEGGTEDETEETEDEKTTELEEPEGKPEDQTIPEEMKDEVIEHQKRAFPQISHYSCRVLKKYGFCKYKPIAKFCIYTCCHDRLSRKSCRYLKYKYKQCYKPNGYFFCRRTCGHCPGKRPRQCKKYRILRFDRSRRQSIYSVKNIKCDKFLASRWYRLKGLGGTYIPNKCVGKYRCGTHAPGWVVGKYPSVYKTVTRKVCYHWGRKCCNWHNYIRITNCKGYYVFYLVKPPVCSLRYCGNR